MVTPTRDQLERLTQRRMDPVHVEALLGDNNTLEQFGITTPLRLAHFLAQACAETGGLSALRENMTYTTPERIRDVFGRSRFPSIDDAVPFLRNPEKLANFVYGGRLGNREPDDGFRYRGGGLIQLTGRENYRRRGDIAGLPLETQPELIEQAAPSLRAALEYWAFLDINQWADRDDILAVSRAVNRGSPTHPGMPHGLDLRKFYWRKAKDILSVTGPAAADELTVGDQGDLIRELQEDLSALGHLLGRADGDFGPQTMRAVKAFQDEHALPVTGVFTRTDREKLDEVMEQPVNAAREQIDALGGAADTSSPGPAEPAEPAPSPIATEAPPPPPVDPSPAPEPVRDLSTTPPAPETPRGSWLSRLLAALFGRR